MIPVERQNESHWEVQVLLILIDSVSDPLKKLMVVTLT